MKRKTHKKYTAFEKVLGLLPKLSAAECLIIRDAAERPTTEHIWYIRRGLKYGRLDSYKRTVDPNKLIWLP